MHDDVGMPLSTIPIHNNNNLQYYGEIGLGSGHKPFGVIFDTGSEKLWVPHVDCTSAVCKAHHRFDPSQSTSFDPSSVGTTNLSYGTGDVRVELHHDSLMFPKATPEASKATAFATQMGHYPLGLATAVAKRPFQNLPMIDGIFGMGPTTPFAHKNLFSVYLSNDTALDGKLMLGGVETKGEPIVWHDTMDGKSWSLELVGVKVGDKLINSGCTMESPCKALIDTGSSNITGPPNEIASLLGKVHPQCHSTNSGNDEITFLIRQNGDKIVPYKLNPKEYSVDFQDTKECNLGISGLNMGEKKWVLGDTFLRRYLSVFDEAHHRVGFVKSHHPDESIGVVTRAGIEQVFHLISTRRRQGMDFLFS